MLKNNLPFPAISDTFINDDSARFNIIRDTVQAIRTHAKNPNQLINKYLNATINGVTVEDLISISNKYVTLRIVR